MWRRGRVWGGGYIRERENVEGKQLGEMAGSRLVGKGGLEARKVGCFKASTGEGFSCCQGSCMLLDGVRRYR